MRTRPCNSEMRCSAHSSTSCTAGPQADHDFFCFSSCFHRLLQLWDVAWEFQAPVQQPASCGASPLPNTVCIRRPMPSSTRPAAPGPSNVSQGSKRVMSDPESALQDPKKARRNPSPEPSTRRDSGRDAKRRRKRKKKAPVVGTGPAKNEATQSRLDEHSRAPFFKRNEIIRFTSAPPEADLPASSVPAAKSSSQAPSSKPFGKSRDTSLHIMDNITDHRSDAMPSTPVRITKSLIRRNAYPPNRETRNGSSHRMSPPLAHSRIKWLNSRQSSNPRTMSVIVSCCIP